METTYRHEIYSHQSQYGARSTRFRILAGPGRRTYSPNIMKLDRIIYIELSQNRVSMEYPFTVEDQRQLWEAVFDVWVLPQKKLSYAKSFFNLIHQKLLQAKLPSFAKPYWGEAAPQSQRALAKTKQ